MKKYLLKTINDVEIFNKDVIIRVDFNVPIRNKKIVDDTRIMSSISTINECIRKKARKIVIITHLGRPNLSSKTFNIDLSIYPVFVKLKEIFEKKMEVIFIKCWKEKIFNIKKMTKKIILLENVRFYEEEIKNSENFSKKISYLGSILILDAFSMIHRQHSSNYGCLKYFKNVCCGKSMEQEIYNLNKVLSFYEKPKIAIIGGSKINTKISLINNLIPKIDYLILGGGIANTFMRSFGYKLGKSLYEDNKLYEIENIKSLANKHNTHIIKILDFRVTNNISINSFAQNCLIENIRKKDIIIDIGNETLKIIKNIICKAKLIFWNGPIGMFEIENFSHGTKEICSYIKESNAYSVAGGGDTISCINKFNIKDNISYISNGGGALLQYLGNNDIKVISKYLLKIS